jgi:hypothetical protein
MMRAQTRSSTRVNPRRRWREERRGVVFMGNEDKRDTRINMPRIAEEGRKVKAR